MKPLRLFFLFTVVAVGIPAAAGDHKVTLTPVSVSRGTVYFTTTVGGGGPTSITTPEPAPNCPVGSNEAGVSYGSVVQCQWNSLSGGTLQKNSDVILYAVLKTKEGKAFAVRMSCMKEIGTCAQPDVKAVYPAELSEDVQWLAKYEKRPVNGPMKVRLRAGGRNFVTYSILNILPVNKP